MWVGKNIVYNVKNFKQFINEGALLPKKVYRGGSEYGGEDYLNSTFYTDSEIEAKKYAKNYMVIINYMLKN